MTRARHNTGPRTARALREAAGRAFTLIEVLIAVGAVALIGVAIAAVFDQTGRTISAGRRLSTMTSYAGLIEQQMRADFSRMTREGFLVINNQLADSNGAAGFQYNFGAGAINIPGQQDSAALHRDELPDRSRARRIDEVMFIIKGDFTTGRDALHPEVIARSNAARIYYGHGKRRIENTATGSAYMTPTLNDAMTNEPQANHGVPFASNPNRFASDWALLRQQTILCSPRSTTVYASNSVLNLPANPVPPDRDEQIAFQPAASSIFRALAAQFPQGGQQPPMQGGNPIRPGLPLFPSGLVDIATTTLPEMRLVVLTADPFPGPGLSANFYDPTFNTPPDGGNDGIDGLWRVYRATGSEYDDEVIDRMQSWMADALPALSHAAAPDKRTRVRFEPAPPNYVGAITDPPTSLLREIARADQVMLGASSFVPRCTEFIVEWSFGKVYPSDTSDPQHVAGREGELIWHGMERLANGDPPPTIPDVDSVAYPYDHTDVLARLQRRYRRVNGAVAADTGANQWVQDFMIHDYTPYLPNSNPAIPGAPLMSFFGYEDPAFEPDKDNDGKLESATDSASPTIPWPWPKLVRVTIGLGDPADPTIEQRHQFVFELPPSPEP